MSPDSCSLLTADAARRRVETLTPRERDVLTLVGQGMSNQDIAPRTVPVRGHHRVCVILLRLALNSRVPAAIVADLVFRTLLRRALETANKSYGSI